MATTYTKLKDGSWGIRSTESVQPGQTVTVTKSSGEKKQETVGRIIWQGKGVTLASIVRSQAPATTKTRRLSDDDRCEVCNGNKWTCGHCVGW